MGGHGGLNILPQKSWNVYGRENRQKVARDEAKHKEEEDAKRENHLEAERHHRRALLLKRAAERDGSELATPVPQDILAGPSSSPPQDSAALAVADGPAAAENPPAEAKPLQHINFFEEHEAREMHPEVVAERKEERRKRGNVDTQTSDAKFDERFKLGYGLTGKAAQPWYSRPVAPIPAEEEVRLIAAVHDVHEQPSAAHLAPLLIKGKAKDKKKDRKKEKRKKEHKDKESKKRMEQLRQERREREAVEREREKRVHRGLAAAETEGYVDKRYHSAFGNAPTKRQRV